MIHSFLRSIGFRELKQNKDLYCILENVVNQPDEQKMTEDTLAMEYLEKIITECNEQGIEVTVQGGRE